MKKSRRDLRSIYTNSFFKLQPSGKKINLLNDKGIDILTNTMEANPLSANYSYYGDLHNNGHVSSNRNYKINKNEN